VLQNLRVAEFSPKPLTSVPAIDGADKPDVALSFMVNGTCKPVDPWSGFPANDATRDALLPAADAALYRGKEQGS
jgi:hypothetical protein